MTTIPEGLPTLSRGAHKPGEGKACAMEYVSLLAGEEWTDTPKCTNQILASVVQFINDTISDEDRHKLVPFFGRLFGTSESEDKLEAEILQVRLRLWSAKQVIESVDPSDRHQATKVILFTQDWLNGVDNKASMSNYFKNLASRWGSDLVFQIDRRTRGFRHHEVSAYDYCVSKADYAGYAAGYVFTGASESTVLALRAVQMDEGTPGMLSFLSDLIDEYDRLIGRNETIEVTTEDLARISALV